MASVSLPEAALSEAEAPRQVEMEVSAVHGRIEDNYHTGRSATTPSEDEGYFSAGDDEALLERDLRLPSRLKRPVRT